MYFLFVIKTRHKSVSRGNSKTTQKEMSKLFLCDYLTSSPFAEKRRKELKKDDGLYLRLIFNEYIKQNIIMAVLRKANFHSVDICRLMKNQSCKKRSRELIQTFF